MILGERFEYTDKETSLHASPATLVSQLQEVQRWNDSACIARHTSGPACQLLQECPLLHSGAGALLLPHCFWWDAAQLRQRGLPDEAARPDALPVS